MNEYFRLKIFDASTSDTEEGRTLCGMFQFLFKKQLKSQREMWGRV